MKYTTQYVETLIKRLDRANAIITRVKAVADKLRKDETCPDWSQELDKALKGE